MEHPAENFMTIFKLINRDTISLLDKIYAEDIIFEDPLHEIHHLHNLKTYFNNMYKNVEQCLFTFDNKIFSEKQAAITWAMTFQHKKLNKGNSITVKGASILIFNSEGKANSHRDFFDLGSLIYEHVPVLGYLIKKIKSQA